jgi:hypothetical protein
VGYAEYSVRGFSKDRFSFIFKDTEVRNEVSSHRKGILMWGILWWCTSLEQDN